MIHTITDTPTRIMRAAVAPDGAVKVTRFYKATSPPGRGPLDVVNGALWESDELTINSDEWDRIAALRPQATTTTWSPATSF